MSVFLCVCSEGKGSGSGSGGWWVCVCVCGGGAPVWSKAFGDIPARLCEPTLEVRLARHHGAGPCPAPRGVGCDTAEAMLAAEAVPRLSQPQVRLEITVPVLLQAFREVLMGLSRGPVVHDAAYLEHHRPELLELAAGRRLLGLVRVLPRSHTRRRGRMRSWPVVCV